jgi:hypothetical protein
VSIPSAGLTSPRSGMEEIFASGCKLWGVMWNSNWIFLKTSKFKLLCRNY